LIEVTKARICFEEIIEDAKILIKKVIIYISIFVVSRFNYKILLDRSFQQSAQISFVNINNSSLKLTIYFRDKTKYISILKMFANYFSNKNKNVVFSKKSLNL